MPRKATTKKKTATRKRTTRKTTRKTQVNQQMVTYNKFFGSLLIALGVGALIVFLRYLIVTWVAPADIYLVEPSQLIPGEVRK